MDPMAEPPAIRRRGAEDRISALPDELLHTILSRVPSPAAAARTSVLSRRWRGIWAGMPVPELAFDGSYATTPSALHVLDSIDDALKLPAAPTFRSLKIDVSGVDRCHVPAQRISPWLRFASQRVAGKLSLSLVLKNDAQSYGDDIEELALPIYERATEIDLHIETRNFYLRPPPTGSFSLLTDLKISCVQMDGGELGRFMSSPRCPRLQKLSLVSLKLEPVRDISISSESLQCFHIASLTGKLEVTARVLQDISVLSVNKACIFVAPKLENVKWLVPYDPHCHQFAEAGRQLQSLSIMHSTDQAVPISSTRLMERFDTVSVLTVYLSLGKGIEEYKTFLKEMEKLPICETLVVYLLTNHHVFAPMVFYLLRRCSCIRNFQLILYGYIYTPSEMPSCTTSDCPCLLPENFRLDDITFDSLEKIGISFLTGSAEQEEFMELLLSRCNTLTLKRVSFIVPCNPVSSEITEVVQRIRSMRHPNSKAQFIVNCREVPKP